MCAGHNGLQLVTRAMTSDANQNQRADPGDQAPGRTARGSPGRPTSSGRPPQCRQAPRSGGNRAANGVTAGFVRRSRHSLRPGDRAHSRPTPRRTRRYDISCCWTFEQADCRRHACISPSASAMPKAAALWPFQGNDRCQPVHESGHVPTRPQETLMRFSTVAGERGTPDTYRDPPGLALKFYTPEANYDMVDG